MGSGTGGDVPLSPQYFKYEFPEGVDSVIVKVTSAMAFPCSVISIQDILVGLGSGDSPQGDPRGSVGLTAPRTPQCPVYDLDNNVAFIGMYQTMTKKAAITVQVGAGPGSLGMGTGPGRGAQPHRDPHVPPGVLTLVSLAVAEEGFPQQQLLRGGGGEDGGRGVRGGSALLPPVQTHLPRWVPGGGSLAAAGFGAGHGADPRPAELRAARASCR